MSTAAKSSSALAASPFSIWVKAASTYTPDYFVEHLPTSPWIHQPFEEYDNMRPDRLAKKFEV